MKPMVCVVAASAVLSLAACSSHGTAEGAAVASTGAAAFGEVLDTYYARPDQCEGVPLPLSLSVARTGNGFSITGAGKPQPGRILDALVSAGLLSAATTITKSDFGSSATTVLTETAGAVGDALTIVHRTGYTNVLCAGHRVVDAVTGSKRAPSEPGKKVWNVAYTYTVKSVPRWATLPSVRRAKGGICYSVGEQMTDTATVALVGGEWKVFPDEMDACSP